ncbi:uncharacterized protein K02A2.6-like [Xenia sp. Carnegie-2017]|uniref:uncharacterized protein K02A2.6-like n=1 Tax=Xenia sp. Carnegie-2017 TaxID=2897299 RepID=UPI001F04BF34|nr:uncharacterized protein K02A2.6-like [Xenia sp. Carnegie-2017]
MDMVLNGLQGVGGILDDLIITGKNDEEHLRNLERALKRLQNMGIKLKKSKCVFMQPSVEYFAFVVDRQGIHPPPRKVQAIREVPTPENPTELKSFLGLVNYYRKFIPNMAKLVNPLNCLLSQEVSWKWSEECQKSFETLKVLLETAPVLTHYDPKKPVRLATDASSCGIGAVLSNVSDEGEEQPIAYASRTLSSSEQNYSMIEKEALAIIFGLKKFHQYVYGRRFPLITDHKPLTMILGPKRAVPVLAVSRLQRWAIQLGAYQYDIEYRTSKNNANVDALSRLPRKSVEEPDEWEEEAAAVNSVQLKRSPVSVSMIREATQKDSVLSRVVYYLLHGWPEGKLPEELQYFFTKQDEFTVEEGCLLRGTRVVIPIKYQGVVLSELHINHPGMVRMKSLARLHVWWSTLDQDIEQTVRDCTSCQFNRCKSPLKVNNPWIWPVRPWQRIHVDFAGPVEGGMYLIVVDAKSKWMEVISMSSTTAAATIQALRSLFSVHGLPEEMVSDNGPQFVAQEMKDFLKGNGIQMHLSSPYHPASNGEAERAVRTFKDSMKIRKNEEGSTGEKLARFLLGYRTTPHTATGCTPAEILMGRRLRTRLDILHPSLANKMDKKSHQLPKLTKRKLEIRDPVMVKDYRARRDRWIQGVIQMKLSPVTYRVLVDDVLWKRHIDQLRSLAGSTVPDGKTKQDAEKYPSNLETQKVWCSMKIQCLNISTKRYSKNQL